MAKPIILPNKEALIHAMEICENSVEGAQYFASQAKSLFRQAPLSEDMRQAVLSKVEEFVKLVEWRLFSNTQPWSGAFTESSGFKNMQKGLAKEAASRLQNMLDLRLDVAISDNSELLRGPSSGGEPMNPDAMDTLFNAWLAQHDVICKGSVLYEATEDGEIKKDAGGDPVKADPEKIRQLISDRQEGFAHYMEDNHLKSATVVQHDYAAVAQQQQKAEAIKSDKPEMASNEAPVVEQSVSHSKY